VRAARRHAELISTRRVSFLLAAVWILAGGVLLLRLEVETQRMKRELSGLQESVAAVAGARRKISEAAEMVQALERSRREREALLSRLVRIGSALPDSSYLTSLALDSNGGGAITGAAREAARVVAALDQTEAAPSPRLDGPVIREVSGGRAWERFTVRFGRADQ
jgi:Tfp pilus assembly protein PilN